MAKDNILSMGLYTSSDNKMKSYNTIADMQSDKLRVGQVVNLLGYYQAGDGAGHKRKIESEDDGSGVQLGNGLWANIIHNGEVNVSWFGDDFFKCFTNQNINKVNVDKDITLSKDLTIQRTGYNDKSLMVDFKWHKLDSSTFNFTLGSLINVNNLKMKGTINIIPTVTLGTGNGCVINNVEFSSTSTCFKLRTTEENVGLWGVNLSNITVRGSSDIVIDIDGVDTHNGWITSISIDNLVCNNPKCLLKQRGKTVSDITFTNTRVQTGSKVENWFDLEKILKLNWGYTNKIWDLQNLQSTSNVIKYIGDTKIQGIFCYPQGFRSDVTKTDGDTWKLKDLIDNYIEVETFRKKKGAFTISNSYFSGERIYKIGEGRFDTDNICNFYFIITGEPSVATSSTNLTRFFSNIVSIRIDKEDDSKSYINYSDKSLNYQNYEFIYEVVDSYCYLYLKLKVYIGTTLLLKDLFYDNQQDIILPTYTIGRLLREEVRVSTVSNPKILNIAFALEQLNTPVMQYAMEQEGGTVKEDYLEYSLEKFKYDKQLGAEEQAKYEAYELALQDNAELTWEEFLMSYPTTIISLEEPVIPETVQAFMNKYLGVKATQQSKINYTSDQNTFQKW